MNARKLLDGVLPASLALFLLGLQPGAGVSADDFVTGGGWIVGTPSGKRANFAIKGGVAADGDFAGHLNYIDHSDGMHVKAADITSYVALDDTTRELQGTASIDGVPGFTFIVVVSDGGEPGRSDTFDLELSSGYSASGVLQGGNIQLHVE